MGRGAWLALVSSCSVLAGILGTLLVQRARSWWALRRAEQTRCIRCGAPVGRCTCSSWMREVYVRQRFWDRSDHGRRRR